jgi:hypothetical protein
MLRNFKKIAGVERKPKIATAAFSSIERSKLHVNGRARRHGQQQIGEYAPGEEMAVRFAARGMQELDSGGTSWQGSPFDLENNYKLCMGKMLKKKSTHSLNNSNHSIFGFPLLDAV